MSNPPYNKARGERWESRPRRHPPFGDPADSPEGWSPRVDASLVEFVEEKPQGRRHLKKTMAEWERDHPGRMSLEDAVTAFEHIEPQMVIERLLSASWGNRGLRRWWRSGEWTEDSVEPDLCVPTESVGPDPFKTAYQQLHDYLELQNYWYLGPVDLGGSQGGE